MKTRRIGSLDVSVVGLGCNNFGERLDREHSVAVVHAALDAGINFLDTADIYTMGRSEEYIGAAIADRRDEVLIGTKFGYPFKGQPAGTGSGAAWIREAVEGSLRRLGTDRIDLFQQHVPDPTVPIEETLAALDELVRTGKVREVGSSNVSVAQLVEADDASAANGWARFASVQNRYHLLDRRSGEDVLPACAERGLAFLPFYPLAAGMLTGKYRRGEPPPAGTRLAAIDEARSAAFTTDRNHDLVDALRDVAESRGRTLVELAFGWLLAHAPIASIIAGASSPEQVRTNVAAADWELGPDDLAAVDAALAGADAA